MRLIVCVKRVPDTTTLVRVKGDGSGIESADITWIPSPYDAYAIEEAIRTKEKHGGEVVALTLDPEPDKINPVLTKVLAVGVDRAIHIHSKVYFDQFQTAKLLAETIKENLTPFDIIFFGRQAIDDDAAQVPTLVAALLGIPRVNLATKLTVEPNKVTATRQVEGGEQVIEMNTPCVISAQKGLNEPRLPSLKGIMEAKKKPIQRVTKEPGASTVNLIRFQPPPPRPPCRIVGEGAAAVPELVRLLREEAKVI